MSNPWKEIFEDIRFDNGNDYFYQSLNEEEEEGGVSSALVNSAVQKIKRIAKRDNVRIQVAMTTFFANTRMSPSERAAIRNKIAEFGESYEFGEGVNSIATGYQRADVNTARSLGAAQTIQQKLDAQRNAQRIQAQQKKQKLTTGGAPAQFGEETMTSAEKKKEKSLKAKYDKSGMKKNMIDQYGEEKGKQFYFAKIRKLAMESKEELADKDYDGDGTLETSKKEHYGSVKNAIRRQKALDAIKKKILNNSFSDWRNDLNFIKEKRYAESPFVEIMPEQSSPDDEDRKSANLRLKPKKSQVSEETELANLLAESLGGKLVEANVTSSTVSSLERSLNKPVMKLIPGGGVPSRTPMAQKIKPQFPRGAKPPTASITPPKVVSSVEKATQAAEKASTKAAETSASRLASQAAERSTARVATQAAERGGSKLLGKTFSRLVPGLNVAMATADAAEKLKKGDTLGATLAAASAAPGPVGWAALGLGTLRDLTTPEKLPEPVKTPKPQAVPSPTTKPSVQPQAQPETQTTTKTKPTGTKVKFPTGSAADSTDTQTQTQTQGQRRKTAVGTQVTTKQDTEDQNKRKRDKLSIDLKTPGQGQGNIYQAVSL